MIIAFFPNMNKSQAINIARDVIHFLQKHQVKVVVEDDLADQLKVAPLSSVSPDEIQFMISLGGDGTILRIAHRHPEIKAPLLGINLGGLGFMADIPLNDIYPSLQDLLEKRYTIQNRMMMEGHSSSGDKCFAVNEIVIHRAKSPSLIELSIYVDDIYLNTFSADGIILSTPTGSTAYSLAAGGPIVSPELRAFVLTPICPHTISNRPIVLMPKHNIQVEYLSHAQPIEVSYDGISTFNMVTNDKFTMTSSSHLFRLVSLARHDYFSTLREKLGWQGKLKS